MCIRDRSEAEITEKIQTRRGNLEKIAKDWYKLLTKEVTVIGTKGKNIFDVTTLQNDILSVNAYHVDDGEKHLIYSRKIQGKDCDELRFYGLKKSDTFNFNGSEKSTIKVKLVGGSGDDVVNNNSTLNIVAYDREDGMELTGNKVKSKLKNQRGINRFDRKEWKLPRVFHFPIWSFYTDEGIGISYNLWWINQGFRKNPYKSSHTASLSYFFGNTAFVGAYTGHWPDAFSPGWDFKLALDGVGPAFTQYFYGLGSEFIDYEEVFPDIEDSGNNNFHIVRGTHIDVNPEIVKDLNNNRSFSINPSLEFYNLDDEPNNPDEEERFIFFPEANRTALDFERKIYAGIGVNYTSDRVNNAVLPTRGYKFNVGADFKQSLTDSEFNNLTLETGLSAYFPFSPTHKVVLATNIGAGYTFGDYEFFHANYLSSSSRLRGFRTNRFAGDGIAYHATDLRVKVFQGKGTWTTAFGLFGSFDYGRSFLADEVIGGEGVDFFDSWQYSWGGGIYVAPLNLFGFKLGYYQGEEDTQVLIGGALAF